MASNADLKDMQPSADFSRGGKNGKSIAVFCWSQTQPGTPRWESAERIGALAAKNGFSVISGGYCGSMEAVSKGAREVIDANSANTNADASAESAAATPDVTGILVPSQFPHRKLVGNQYLTKSIDSLNLCNRLHLLTANSRYFVLLPGTMGSLTELLIIWSLALLNPPHMAKPLIICMRDPWEKMVKSIERDLALPASEAALLTFVDTVDEAMDLIIADAAKTE